MSHLCFAITFSCIKIDFDNFRRICCGDSEQSEGALFSHLTELVLLHYLAEKNLEIASFHLKAACCIVNKCTEHIQIIVWSLLNDLHFQNVRLFTRQDRGICVYIYTFS